MASCCPRFGSALANGPLDALPPCTTYIYPPTRHADLLATDISEELCIKYIDRFLMFYIATADRLQRTSAWMEKLEGGACCSVPPARPPGRSHLMPFLRFEMFMLPLS